jgi:hypothetical protein
VKRLGRVVSCLALLVFCGASDDCDHKDSDVVKSEQQEKILMEGASSVGMPSIKNFRELRLLKDIYELRDQGNYSTYSYLWNEMTGKLVFFCSSIGYPIPYATQFTSPQKIVRPNSGVSSYVTVPQADPNGLFSPASADGTWVMCKNPKGDEVKAVYVEPHVIASPFPLL